MLQYFKGYYGNSWGISQAGLPKIEDVKLLEMEKKKTFCYQLHINLFIKRFVITQFWIQHGSKMDPKNV